MTAWDVLGIKPGTSSDDIKRAYRQRMKECHPDLHPNDPDANKKAIMLTKAYEMLTKTQPEPQRVIYQHVWFVYGNTFNTSTTSTSTFGGYW